MLLKLFSLFFFISFALFGSDDILSNSKQTELILKKKQTVIRAEILEKSWINPIVFSMSQSTEKKDNLPDSKSTGSTISFSQDIFRSGGIYYALKYANIKREYGLISIKYQKNLAIVEAYKTFLSIRKLDLQIRKQKLIIDNQDINIKRKREQFLAGIIDSSLLNSAIIDQNRNRNTLLDLETNYEKVIDNFSNISDKKYKEIAMINLHIPDKESFLKDNLVLLSQDLSIVENNYYKKITVSKYLPKIIFNTSYTKKTEPVEMDIQSYGFTLSIPFGINTFKDIETSTIDLKLAQNSLDVKKKSELSFYVKTLANIKRIEKKKILANRDLSLYDSLIEQIKEQLMAQMKTEDDLIVMKNSKQLRVLDLEIYTIDRQLEILPIYGKMNIDF